MKNLNHECYQTDIPKLEAITEKYSFVSTKQFVADVESQGLQLTAFRGPAKGLGLHYMEFSSSVLKGLEGIDFKLYATNSHDGSAAFRTGIAMLRLVCANGMVATVKSEEARILHRGYAVGKVGDAVAATLRLVEEKKQAVQAMQEKTLNADELLHFLSQAKELRSAQPSHVTDLMQVRRQADKADDFWSLFNRVQEALVRGGYHTAVETEIGIVSGPRAREVKAVRERLAINQGLWAIAQSLMEAK